MRAARSLITAFGLTIALLPATALAQSAGDEQYADPFDEQPSGQQPAGQQPSGQQPSGGSDNRGSSGGNDSTPTGSSNTQAAPVASQPDPAAAAELQDGRSQLPVTGLEVIPRLVAGAILLLAGVTVRRAATRPPALRH